jgi:tripartite-type tricarboxylate transporter receptor subunit TctC
MLPRALVILCARIAAFTAVALLALPGGVSAQTYPNRPIRLISPFPAGGGNDVLARIVAAKLADRLKGTVVVENRPGAGAVIGITATAKSPPDGYTLVLSGSTLAVAPTLYKNPPFDPNKDFAPVALVAQYPFLLVATASLPANTVPELLKLAKDKPGEVMYASPGVAASQHLFAEGTLKALGVSSAERLSETPDVSPIADTVPGFDASNWSIVLAPAGTPKDIVDRLHAELKVVMGMPEVRGQLDKIGMIPIVSPSPAELATFVSTEVARWGKIVQQAGIAGAQ